MDEKDLRTIEENYESALKIQRRAKVMMAQGDIASALEDVSESQRITALVAEAVPLLVAEIRRTRGTMRDENDNLVMFDTRRERRFDH